MYLFPNVCPVNWHFLGTLGTPADSATAGWAELENGFAVLQAERDALKKEVRHKICWFYQFWWMW